jgi:hypothetical protein
MNITKATGLVPASFDFPFYNNDGELEMGKVNLKLFRTSYRQLTSADFKEAMEKADDQPEIAAELLVKTVAEWDLTEDDEGKIPFPLTLDNIIDREPAFIHAMTNAVFERMFPNPQKAENSQGGSAQKANTKTAP